MTLVYEQQVCRRTCACFFYSIFATVQVYRSLDLAINQYRASVRLKPYLAKQCYAYGDAYVENPCLFCTPPLWCYLKAMRMTISGRKTTFLSQIVWIYLHLIWRCWLSKSAIQWKMTRHKIALKGHLRSLKVTDFITNGKPMYRLPSNYGPISHGFGDTTTCSLM